MNVHPCVHVCVCGRAGVCVCVCVCVCVSAQNTYIRPIVLCGIIVFMTSVLTIKPMNLLIFYMKLSPLKIPLS